MDCSPAWTVDGEMSAVAAVLPLSKLWQPRSWRFMLERTLKALPQPACGHLKGFSPVCEWLWIRRLLGRLKALLHVWQMYLSWLCGKSWPEAGCRQAASLPYLREAQRRGATGRVAPPSDAEQIRC